MSISKVKLVGSNYRSMNKDCSITHFATRYSKSQFFCLVNDGLKHTFSYTHLIPLCLKNYGGPSHHHMNSFQTLIDCRRFSRHFLIWRLMFTKLVIHSPVLCGIFPVPFYSEVEEGWTKETRYKIILPATTFQREYLMQWSIKYGDTRR